MVMALGKLSEARRRGREEGRAEGREEGLVEGRAEGLAEGLAEGREKMARTMREIGRPETEIQQALDRFDNRRNGEGQELDPFSEDLNNTPGAVQRTKFPVTCHQRKRISPVVSGADPASLVSSRPGN